MSLLESMSKPVDDLGFDPRRAGLQRQEMAAMYRKRYDKKLALTRLVSHLVTALGFVIFFGSLVCMGAYQPIVNIEFPTIAMIGLVIVVMGKMGLWVSSMKLNMLRAIKDLELQVADLADAVRAQAGTTPPPQGPPTTQAQG